nr:immunoglobulin light chain junction region [Macaca mulatta]
DYYCQSYDSRLGAGLF